MRQRIFLLALLIFLSAALAACGTAERKNSSQSVAGVADSVEGFSSVPIESGTISEAELLPHMESLPESSEKSELTMEETSMKITANGISFTASFAENSSAEAFRELLKQGPVTIEMHDYGNFEKVGPLGTSLPTNDEPITTEPGDIILYQGTSVTVYYDTNHWNFTRLGKIPDVTKEDLLEAFGSGNVAITFALE